jgi:outer membrane protein assembly factor BamD (BamD/ComL family)
MEEVLGRADDLIQKGEYEKAKFLLLQYRLRVQEGVETEPIDRALESLDKGAEKSPLPEERTGPTSEETLRVATSFIERERYEEALDQLNELKRKEDLSPEAKGLESLAVEKIINRERNKAAKLFLLARNTADPVKKEGFLRSSYDILKAVVDKYPTSPLNKRINENLRTIQEELKKLKREG